MSKLKVMSVFGTRPEAIKMAPVVKCIEAAEDMESIVCVTAQHREMLDQVLNLFAITPDYDLNIMKSGQTLSEITSRALTGIEAVLQKARPDIVLVHGDTTTTFTGALAAFYQQIPVGHVEAGLRSGNKYSPYPEEINRTLTGRLAELHFAPTVGNRENLLREGVDPARITITGNTVIDALKRVVRPDYRFEVPELNRVDFGAKRTLLLTAHRRENLGKPMEAIFEAILQVHRHNPDVEVIFPVHMNPRVRELAHRYFGEAPFIHLIEPLDYEPFANLQAKVDLILTDSGGIQEEAPALGKPVLVLRTETERPEAVAAGTVAMAGIETDTIFAMTHELLNNPQKYDAMANAVNPYGDGQAAPRTLEAIRDFFNRK